MNVKKEEVYYFDSTFRPVPLLQKFIGVKEPKNKIMDIALKDKNIKVKRNKKHIYDE